MKDAFENNLKESLENFEMPYNASAWTAMHSTLNANSGASSSSFEQQFKESLNGSEYAYNPAAWTALNEKLGAPKGKSFTKWYVAAGILVIATASIWYIAADGSLESTKPFVTTNTSEKNSKIDQQNPTNNNSNSVASNGDQNKVNATSTSGTTTSENSTQSGNRLTNASGNVGSNTSTNAGNINGTNSSNGTNGIDPTPPRLVDFGTAGIPELEWNYFATDIGTICQGTNIQIENKNSFAIQVKYPNGLIWTGRDNGITTLNPSLAGTYTVGYLRNNTFIEKETFVVTEAPKADFEFVDLSQKYLNGLPTVEVRTNVAAQNYAWKFDGVSAQGPSAAGHFFTKGAHTISLNVTDASGCSSSIAKTINIDENYNLIAMNGFEPLDLDPRNNTFLPYALKERNVGFKMIILDPKDGHLIYETSDASQGWNGIDQSTGTMVKFNTAYIWKVTLNSTAPGEKSEYAGTIIPTQR